MAGYKSGLYLLVPMDSPWPLRENSQANAGDITTELCERCWSPVLQGKMDDHLQAIPHRQPPLGQQSPEG